MTRIIKHESENYGYTIAENVKRHFHFIKQKIIFIKMEKSLKCMQIVKQMMNY